jgi:hypothetical protein
MAQMGKAWMDNTARDSADQHMSGCAILKYGDVKHKDEGTYYIYIIILYIYYIYYIYIYLFS